jgi:hypothetical protein
MIERIYIPTVRRANNQITFDNLPDELKERVVMVVESGERPLYTHDCEYLEIPDEFVGTWTQLAQTRKFIHKHAGAIKYTVADDDILIKRRNSKYWTENSNMEMSKRLASHDEILLMYETVDKWLDEPDIGVVGLSDAGTPPSKKEFEDTKDVYSFIFYDGRMLSKVIDEMDITSLRIAEDVLFLYEALSRGINTRKSTEWVFDNRSMVDKDLQDTRIVWSGMYADGEQPKNYYQSDAHYDAMRYIQKKYPHGVKIFEKDGKMKNIKYWKKVYRPLETSSLSNFID